MLLAVVLVVSGASGVGRGSPAVSGASGTAELVGPVRGERLTSFKKKRRKHHRRKMGHRQDLTQIRITGITAG